MSIFYRYTKSEYVEALRAFLHAPKGTFKRAFGFTSEETRKGSPGPRYPEAAMLMLEPAATRRAARVEANDTMLPERYCIARDYQSMTDAAVAQAMGVSRELARRWGCGKNRPTNMPALAGVLKVPPAWLEFGGEHHLPATTHLGVRLGDESKVARENLYALTAYALADMSAAADDDAARVYIERAVLSRPELAREARRAGGRWQVLGGALLFAPWVPIPSHDLSRRLWADEVEVMIEEELASKHSVYAAWHALKARCELKGLAYPQRIALHKRLDKEKAHLERFGVDLNAVVAASLGLTANR